MNIRYLWFLGAMAFAFVLCLFMLWRIEKRVMISIEGIETPQDEAISIGRGSVVDYDRVPQDFITIHRTSTGFEWNINPKWLKSDSLYYFKVNNSNPNIHPLTDGSAITIDITDNSKRNVNKTLEATRIKEILSDQNSHYVMLRNAIELDKQLRADSTDATDYKTLYNLRSFLYREGSGDDWQLVILDRYTTLYNSAQEKTTYATSDSVQGTNAKYCKIQFFRIVEYNIKPDKADHSLFHIGDVNYLCKPVLVSTKWGAGHVNIVAVGDKNEVRFSKPLTYIGTMKALREMSPTDNHLITIHQDDGTFPSPTNVYIPHFSSAVNNDVCNLRLTSDGILLSGKPLPSSSGLTPQLNHLRHPSLHCNVMMHTAVISMGYIMSYLWLPLFVAILLILGFVYVMRPGRREAREIGEARSRLSVLFPLIVVIAFIYFICKVMISMKLAYTYPYFERLASIVVTDACMMFVLLYLLSLIINHHLLVASVRVKSYARRWIALGVGIVTFMLCLYAFRSIDSYVTGSYLPEELGSWRFWKWSGLSGVTDTYRSVPLALLLCNLISFGVLIVINIDPLWKWIKSKWEGFHDKLEKMLPNIVYTMLPIVAVVAASVIPGNFSTAFITLFVILGMSWSLRLVSYTHGRMIAFIQMLVITFVYIIAAIALGDKGYITNYIGFVAAAILLYFMSAKGKASRHEGRYTLLIAVGTLLFAVFLLPRLMPMKYDVNEVSYDRTARRFELFSQFDKYLNSGYRYAVADAEFMTVLTHYMYNTSGSDPLSPEKHPLHPSVSSGQSPVVVNDVAVPSSFFGSYGFLAYILFFGLIVMLCCIVVWHNMKMPEISGRVLSSSQLMWRTLAVMMWAGTSIYLYASYIGGVPFTGRLCPGLGVDAVGEAIESTLLLAFMTATSKAQEVNS